jgi:hypothetical protein
MLNAMSQEPIPFLRAESPPAARTVTRGGRREVVFDRRELDQILRLYGRMVALGEWRDYAIDFLSDKAVFSIYRRGSEAPLFRIEKCPAARSRQGMYSVVAAGGYVLKRGPELANVLRMVERKVECALRLVTA